RGRCDAPLMPTLVLSATFGIANLLAVAAHSQEITDRGLRVGSELLTWGEEGPIKTLEHDGRVVVRATNTYVVPPFTILDRWKSSKINAVLLQAGVTATKDCSLIYVIENRQPGSVVSHELGTMCVSLDMPTTERNAAGFAFGDPATPTTAGKSRQWEAETGKIVARRLEFRLYSGSTMVELVSGQRPA